MGKKILLVHTFYSSFVKTDYEILSSVHQVTRYQFDGGKSNLKHILQFIKQSFYLLFTIWKFDAVFIWFADYHSLLPVLFAKLLAKKSFVVIGGYDAARIPELNYGGFQSKLRGFCTLTSMKNCTLNLPVSKHIERKVKWITKKSNTQLVYNCVKLPETEKQSSLKEKLVVTVGLFNSERTYFVKGIDTYIDVARKLPDVKFKIIGVIHKAQSEVLQNLPSNIEIIGFLKPAEMVEYFKQAKIYCQLSRTESFGIALAEAMYYSCIPVVTNIGGLPEVVGNTGFIVKRKPEAIAEIIAHIIDSDMPNSNSRDRINNLFLFQNRKTKLLEALLKSF